MPDRLTGTLQENLITLLCHSDEHGRVISNLIDDALFEGDYRQFAIRAIDYWKRHNEAPKEHTVDLVGEELDDDDNRKAPSYRQIIGQMIALYEGINTEYVMARLQEFVRQQHLKTAILSAADRLQAGGTNSLEEVEGILNDVLRTRELTFDGGTRLTDGNRALSFLDHQADIFRTGIPELDRRGLGPARKELSVLIAPRSRGKSWWLIHLGKLGLLQRVKVLHITLEMSDEQVLQRYFQSLFSIAKRPGEIIRAVFEFDELGRLSGIEEDMVKPTIDLQDKKIREFLTKRISEWGVRLDKLMIKQFPTRGLTTQKLRGYLDNLETIEGFIPDILLLDYGQLLHTDPNNHRIGIGRNYEDLRGIAVERNIAVVTAHQSNRAGAESSKVLDTQIAEDFSVTATADVVITHSRTEEEDRLGLARLYVAKARNDEDRFTILIAQAYSIGQFVLESTPMESRYWERLAEAVGDIEGDPEEQIPDDEED